MTNNTIPNVPRELLENLIDQHITAHGCTTETARQAQLMLSAPSPAGVYSADPLACPGCASGCFRCASPAGAAGLEVVAWMWRDIDGGVQFNYMHPEGEPLCRLSDAQAIIDGLRSEVEELRKAPCECGAPVGYVSGDKYHAEHERLRECRSERDQHAQRIGELDGLLREALGELGHDCHHALRPRIDAALSAGKEGE